MRKPELVLLMLFIALIGRSAFAQNPHFKLESKDHQLISIDESFSESSEIKPFKEQGKKIYGLAASADIEFTSGNGWVRLVLLDQYFNEHLLLESYPNLNGTDRVSLNDYAEETALLDGIVPYAISIEIKNASVLLKSLSYSSKGDVISDYNKQKKEKRSTQNKEKIEKLNKNLKANGQHWVAGETSVSAMSYGERKKLYGQSTFPAGFEFYSGGVLSTSSSNDGSSTILKSATTSSPYVDDWDWRDRHGKNWISPVTNQGACGSCWAFAATGATEAMANLYFNQQLNLDLSEQDVLSCSGGGSCAGGYPSSALNYIKNTGVVDENTFPYNGIYQPCENKGTNPSEKIKISGRIDFGLSLYPRTEEDILKRMLIKQGPLSSALSDWNHAIVLVGYKVVEEGDIFFYRDLSLDRYWITIESGNPLIGKTVWIYKNSWGSYFGDAGYIYVETDLSNITNTHAIQTPIVSSVNTYEVVCTDNDSDGYYWWGLGEKPANCPPCPDLADGDDSDPTKGPLDEYGYCMPLNTTTTAPVANFTSTSTAINKGQHVSFTDLTTNTPTSWSWTFEGGTPSTSTEQNPTTTYNTTGTFYVSLTVSNAEGTDTKTETAYITVTEPVSAPIASFSASPATINEGSQVSFTDLTTNEPTTWNWIFEGGTPAISNDQNPKVIFGTPGTYDVTLKVTNSGGTSTKTIENYITVEATPDPFYCISTPNATNEWIAEVYVGENSYSSGSDGYSDNTATNFNFVAGSNNSLMLVPGFSGKSSFEYWSIWIDFNLDMNFTEDEKVFTSSKSKSSISGTIYIPQTNITTRMRIAMGSSSPSACDFANSGEVEDYTITISEPAPAPPVAAFSANATAIVAEQTVQFSNLSENEPTSYQWYFPGGTPSASTEPNPTVTYATSGAYDVTLIAYKTGFTQSELTMPHYITVSDNEITPTPSDYCEPALISSTTYYLESVNIGNSLAVNSYGDEYSFNTNPFTLNAGDSYTVSLVPNNSSSRNFWRIWIDFNNDGDFDDADETVLALNNKKGSVAETLAIPSYVTGTTRVRISMKVGKTPAACDDDFEGEVEDYLVSFAPQMMQSSIPKASSLSMIDMNLSVYPNPTTDRLNLHLPDFSGQSSYAIFNTVGKRVIEQPINAPLTTIDMSDKAPGIYLVVVKTDAQIVNKKVIKR